MRWWTWGDLKGDLRDKKFGDRDFVLVDGEWTRVEKEHGEERVWEEDRYDLELVREEGQGKLEIKFAA